jgi:hypothetical protein
MQMEWVETIGRGWHCEERDQEDAGMMILRCSLFLVCKDRGAIFRLVPKYRLIVLKLKVKSNTNLLLGTHAKFPRKVVFLILQCQATRLYWVTKKLL